VFATLSQKRGIFEVKLNIWLSKVPSTVVAKDQFMITVKGIPFISP